jgi:hypothetical protein
MSRCLGNPIVSVLLVTVSPVEDSPSPDGMREFLVPLAEQDTGGLVPAEEVAKRVPSLSLTDIKLAMRREGAA